MKEISKKLGLDKKELNKFLYHSDKFEIDDNYCWHVTQLDQLILQLEATWVDSASFERSLLKTGCVLNSRKKRILVKLPEGCNVMLSAGARLLSLVNQLVHFDKNVTIDFSECQKTLNYFNRAGFFDLLDGKVKVLPERPRKSLALKYQGNNTGLVEFGLIDPDNPDDKIPKQLTQSFVAHTNLKYQIAAFTVFSELSGNVEDHSNTPIPGFAALQKYGEGSAKHIQTIVSDSGVGIAATIKPALKEHYPNLYSKLNIDDIKTDIFLITQAFIEGGLSQFGSAPEVGRGLGLNRSMQSAIKYNAKLYIRQETFTLEFVYTDGILVRVIEDINLPKILGTHICFDFFVA